MHRKKALFALLLLVPAPSVGVVMGMYLFPDTMLGKSLFVVTKVWLFLLPVVWLKWVDKGTISFSSPKKGGVGMGVLTGCGISLIIWGAYCLFGNALINKAFFIEKMRAIGLGSGLVYFSGAAYWILINSVLEEYVWRWFCVEKAEILFPRWSAIIVSALCFTLHHVLALMVYFNVPAVALFSTGVFVGGAIWSFMYLKYRSVWPGYLSHAIVDLCIFGIGAELLFG